MAKKVQRSPKLVAIVKAPHRANAPAQSTGVASEDIGTGEETEEGENNPPRLRNIVDAVPRLFVESGLYALP